MESFRIYEEVQEHIFVEQDQEASEAARQELASLQLRLIDFKNFSGFFATRLGSTFDTSVFWGLLELLFTVENPTVQ